jgi:hypothetical protein
MCSSRPFGWFLNRKVILPHLWSLFKKKHLARKVALMDLQHLIRQDEPEITSIEVFQSNLVKLHQLLKLTLILVDLMFSGVISRNRAQEVSNPCFGPAHCMSPKNNSSVAEDVVTTEYFENFFCSRRYDFSRTVNLSSVPDEFFIRG